MYLTWILILFRQKLTVFSLVVLAFTAVWLHMVLIPRLLRLAIAFSYADFFLEVMYFSRLQLFNEEDRKMHFESRVSCHCLSGLALRSALRGWTFELHWESSQEHDIVLSFPQVGSLQLLIYLLIFFPIDRTTIKVVFLNDCFCSWGMG